MLKAILATLALAPLLLAQDKPADDFGAPGCGDPNAKFEVKTEKAKHPAQAEAGKALVFFIEDDSDFEMNPRPTTMMGLDGAWVGATHGTSYFYASVDPGAHHVCANWQKARLLLNVQKTAALHFTAEAGGAYYFEARNMWWRDHGGTGRLTLSPLDSDQGRLLTDTMSFSISHQKN